MCLVLWWCARARKPKFKRLRGKSESQCQTREGGLVGKTLQNPVTKPSGGRRKGRPPKCPFCFCRYCSRDGALHLGSHETPIIFCFYYYLYGVFHCPSILVHVHSLALSALNDVRAARKLALTKKATAKRKGCEGRRQLAWSSFCLVLSAGPKYISKRAFEANREKKATELAATVSRSCVLLFFKVGGGRRLGHLRGGRSEGRRENKVESRLQ